MKFNPNIRLRNVAGEHLFIRHDGGVTDMTEVVAFNEASVDLYQALKDREFELDEVLRAMADIYEVTDPERAQRDAVSWVDEMRRQGLIV